MDAAEFGPMRYTEEPVPPFAKLQDLLEVFSFEVTELKGILSWPIDVFGLISVRDSLDRNRNYIFERTRNYCQTLTAKVPLCFMEITAQSHQSFDFYTGS
jgi:hypothetical protein